MSNHAPKVDPVTKLFFVASAIAILLVVFILLNSLVNTYKRNSTKGEIDSSYLVEAASDNLKPIGVSAVAGAVATTASAGRSGKEIYDAVCTACHATGVLNSPKFGDKAAWEPRAAAGLDSLLNSATNGKGSMPAKGGDPSITDAELKAVVLYMTKEAGIDLGGAKTAVKKEATKAPAKVEEKKEAVVETSTPAKVAPAEPEVTKAPEPKTAPAEPTTPKEPEVPNTPVATAEVEKTVAPVASSEDGKKIYDTTCFACHATGVAGSPKFADKEAWAPRIATGMDALYNTALHGKGAMPPKGGNVSLDDDKVKAAVDYMVQNAK